MAIPSMSHLRRIVENADPQTVKLSDLYDDDELTDPRESLHLYVDEKDLLLDFPIKEMSPQEAKTYMTPRGDITVFDAFKKFASKDQKQLVKEKAKQYDHSRIIVLCNDTVVDGNHHLLAGIIAKQPIKYINLAHVK